MKSASMIHKLEYLIGVVEATAGRRQKNPGPKITALAGRKAPRQPVPEQRHDIDESDIRYHDLSQDMALIMDQLAQARQQRFDASGFDR